MSDIIANDFVGFDAMQLIVDILSSDLVFSTDSDCRTWRTTPAHGPQMNIRAGTWLVGSQITPGTYIVQAQYGCYWERLRHFEGTVQGIIANDFVSSAGQRIVTIAASDVGFMTDADCGTWTRVQAQLAPAGDLPSAIDIERNRSMYEQSRRR